MGIHKQFVFVILSGFLFLPLSRAKQLGDAGSSGSVVCILQHSQLLSGPTTDNCIPANSCNLIRINVQDTRIIHSYNHIRGQEIYPYMVCWLCITSNSHPAKWRGWWNRGAIQYAANIYGRDAQTYCQGAEGAAYCFIIRGAQVARTESVGVLLLLRAPNPSQSHPLPGGPARQLYKDRKTGKGNEITKTIVKYCQQCSEL